MPRYIYYSSFVVGAGSAAFLPLGFAHFLQAFSSSLLAVLLVCLALSVFFKKHAIGLVLAVCVGLFVSQLHLSYRINSQLNDTYQGKEVVVNAVVLGLPKHNQRAVQFDVLVSDVTLRKAQELVPLARFAKIRLSWYKNNKDFRAPSVGERWQFVARLKRPRGLVNPGGFDYHAWLLGQGYAATGYVRSAADLPPTAMAVPYIYSFQIAINQWREHILQSLFSKRLSNEGVLQALLVGYKANISAQGWHVLQATGTVHLMAISGLHIGLVAGLGFLFGRAVSALAGVWLGGRLTFWLPALTSILLACSYAALAGFSLPTQRALILVVALNAAKVCGLRVNFFDVLSIAAAIILLLDPFAFYSPGFWLSFGAVVVLVVSVGLGRSYACKWQVWLAAQLAVFIGLLMPLALLDLPVSLVSPVANIVAVPVVSFSVVPLLLLAVAVSGFSASFAAGIVVFADGVMNLLWQFLTLLQELTLLEGSLLGLKWFAQGLPFWAVVSAAVLGALLLLSPKGLGLRFLGGLVFLLLLSPVKREDNRLKITALDVGQGLAVVVNYQEFTLVYDTGDWYSSSFDMGRNVILPYLRKHAIGRIDLVVLSHGDSDHIGGFQSLQNSMNIGGVIVGGDMVQNSASNLQLSPRERCEPGQAWQHGALKLQIVHPGLQYTGSSRDNNLSCVLLLEFNGFKMLLPGDIEAEAEARLVRTQHLTNVDVLIAPHHGSKTSSSPAFLQLASPQQVIVSAGFRNKFRHPHQSVLAAYRSLGATVANTATDGAVSIVVEPSGKWQLSKARETNAKLWYQKAN